MKARRTKLRITVIGTLNLAKDISPAPACEVIESVRVGSVFSAGEAVKAALVSRTA